MNLQHIILHGTLARGMQSVGPFSSSLAAHRHLEACELLYPSLYVNTQVMTLVGPLDFEDSENMESFEEEERMALQGLFSRWDQQDGGTNRTKGA